MKRELFQSAAFIRSAKKLRKRNAEAYSAVMETLNLLQKDAFDPSLRTHKLQGELLGLWACSGGYDLRIVFEFFDNNGNEAILLISCGTHDEVY